MKRIVLCVCGVAAGMAALSAAAWADPPARVGRLSYLDGQVSFASVSVDTGGTWEAAALNLPITAGNQLSTAPGARAEVQIGSAAVRLAPDSSMTFEALDDQTVQIRLDQGDLSVRLREMAPDQAFEVDTQTSSVSLAAPGSYRISQKGTGEAAVTTWNGDAAITGSSVAFHLMSGQAVSIPATGPDASLVASAPPADSWDQWVAQRDSQEDQVASARYASSEMDGVQDLDQYGSWRIIAAYGPVWVPMVSVGWAPYTLGRWVWIAPWGWTWVDAEPWGFAPFHYGRWVFVTGSWCWAPGPVVRHPVFAPALVQWVGGTPWRGQPPDRAHITWVPLRPWQAYRPPYEASPTYRRSVNGMAVIPRAPVPPAPVMRPPFAVPRQPYSSVTPYRAPEGQPFISRRPAYPPATIGRAPSPWARPYVAPPRAIPPNGGPRAYPPRTFQRPPRRGQNPQDPDWLNLLGLDGAPPGH